VEETKKIIKDESNKSKIDNFYEDFSQILNKKSSIMDKPLKFTRLSKSHDN
jgi:hypothetical protein